MPLSRLRSMLGSPRVSFSSLLPFLGLCMVIELWAQRAADPDFPLPDPFHPLVALLFLLYVAAQLVPYRQVRLALMTLAFAIPTLTIGMEMWLAYRDSSTTSYFFKPSDDLLLRYTYRPGSKVGDAPGGASIEVTADALYDLPHVVPKPAGVLRVVVLGDSVPNDRSIPFASRFTRRLEAMLGERLHDGRRVEVVNVSCEGYNTLQEVRLLEKVGLRYQPDLVIVAYVLNDPFLQNGAYRRLGNSFFTFRLTAIATVVSGNSCGFFSGMHDGYPFDLVVRSSFERLRMLAEQHRFRVLVAPLPLVAPFDDPRCMHAYDKVVAVAAEQGFSAGRVVDAFKGEDYLTYAKPGGGRYDITHPNAAGHEKMARRLADLALPLLPSP